ncbi:1,4-dihydroxy-2-naphthoate octaprenyltransferase [Dethiosulfatibacter aminovorans DSM 17477]|uniref:1,4-dihydroxy-2-naphthoate octaprenyltransferase n=1 Tax=Dethiosulfatibacter aminovorans DSM 17477 TaxID=1121476 RepID=A0A1M6C8V3_9FIRM|nr:prenyltransferase [Dethiosulfatibacter aminovorans]SHI57406.1 1,4-dihydroxy-2-naphthoate octaprenyltransferase [Dethiosulfatibacter aminovorans DSM 17477]
MTLKGFLKLVEIQTKLASMIPFMTGTIFCIYRYGNFKFSNFVLMFVSLLSFDMTTTAVNNYMDYRNAKKREGYGFEIHNSIVRNNLTETSVKTVIFTLLTIAVASGIILAINTNIIVLIIGIVSFCIGILYTWGPVPINRTPFGEIFSGFFMGFVIIFLSVYIHLDINSFLKLSYNGLYHSLRFDIFEIIIVFAVSLPCTLSISNIMLANNICDMEDDRENARHTLPLYIGKEQSLRLFSALYFISYAAIVFSVILRAVPIFSLLTLLTVYPLTVNLRLFYFKQTKKHTFSLSIKNFMLICVSYLATIVLGLFI